MVFEDAPTGPPPPPPSPPPGTSWFCCLYTENSQYSGSGKMNKLFSIHMFRPLKQWRRGEQNVVMPYTLSSQRVNSKTHLHTKSTLQHTYSQRVDRFCNISTYVLRIDPSTHTSSRLYSTTYLHKKSRQLNTSTHTSSRLFQHAYTQSSLFNTWKCRTKCLFVQTH